MNMTCKNPVRFLLPGGLAALLLVTFCALTPSQVPGRRAAASRAKPEAPKKEEKKEAQKPDKWLLVKGGDVHPVSGPVQKGTSILVKNSKIARIGRDLEVPEGAEVLDATGLRVYPGMVAINGSGLVGTGGGGKIQDSYDPYGLPNVLALGSGITTAILSSTAVKVTYGTIEDVVLREGIFLGLFYSSRNPSTKRKLVADLDKARNFIREVIEYQAKKKAGDKEAKEPKLSSLGGAARYVPLLEGKIHGVFNVSASNEILEACEVVERYGFKAVFRGVDEGWSVASQVGRSGAIAIVTPRSRRDADETTNRPNGTSIENAALLHRHGVPVAIAASSPRIDMDGTSGRDALALATSAGYAVRGGMPESAAIVGVTLGAARAYGLDDRVGSLEVGKDADMILVDGELLHFKTLVQYAVVNGRLAYDKEKTPLLRHIRPRKPELEIGEQWWPRRFGAMPDSWIHDAGAAAVRRLDEIEKKRAEEKKKSKAEDSGKKKSEDSKATPKKAQPSPRKKK